MRSEDCAALRPDYAVEEAPHEVSPDLIVVRATWTDNGQTCGRAIILPVSVSADERARQEAVLHARCLQQIQARDAAIAADVAVADG